MADIHEENKWETQESLADARETTEQAASEGSTVPFADGFTARAIVGALFVTFVMLPGSLYLGLMVGQSMGSAAQWVTIILFAELARRSFSPLSRQEIYIIFGMASMLVNLVAGEQGLSGGPFGIKIWQVYFRGSAAAQAMGLTKDFDRLHWLIPPSTSQALIDRTFMHSDWTIPIVLLVVGTVLGWANSFGLGYVLFRVTSDLERLPFPMAAVNSGGATALAEAGNKEESWRWRLFSIGSMVGIIFGFFHIGIPIFTGAVMMQPVQIIPIPFLDLNQSTESFLPAAMMGIDLSLGPILAGFVLPFPLVVGSATAQILSQVIAAPALYHAGMMPMWKPGMSTLYTRLATGLNFWMSFTIGTGIAVGVIGVVLVVKSVMAGMRQGHGRFKLLDPPEGRGDIPISWALGLWAVSTILGIWLTHTLVPNFSLIILLAFGFLYTPIISYVSARMMGLASQPLAFPFVREATIVRSGYQGLDIWYAPFPMADHGGMAQGFRELELTRTKITSVIKQWWFTAPLMMVASFVFWSFFWKTSNIPSAQFPYAQKFWPLIATGESIFVTANRMKEDNFFLQAIKPAVIFSGSALTFALYGLTSVFKVPVLYFYGFVSGIGVMPTGALGSLVGAFLSKYYFGKRFGYENWAKFAPVLLAGYWCGNGLIAMGAIGLALIVKVTNFLPF
ncbi:MAG TPA: peptide transporter [Armatimonadota bacterium]